MACVRRLPGGRELTAEAFRRWYTSRNLTQAQVAGLLGIRQRRVSDMATGKSPVSRQTARQVAMATLLAQKDGVSLEAVSLALDVAFERAGL